LSLLYEKITIITKTIKKHIPKINWPNENIFYFLTKLEIINPLNTELKDD